MIRHKSIILNDSEASPAAKLKIGETMMIIRPFKKCSSYGKSCGSRKDMWHFVYCTQHPKCMKCHPGDILAVKERWVYYDGVHYWADAKSPDVIKGICSARFMPIEHARTWLRVQDVKVVNINKVMNCFGNAEGVKNIKAWNRRYPKHKWHEGLRVVVITAERVKRPKGA